MGVQIGTGNHQPQMAAQVGGMVRVMLETGEARCCDVKLLAILGVSFFHERPRRTGTHPCTYIYIGTYKYAYIYIYTYVYVQVWIHTYQYMGLGVRNYICDLTADPQESQKNSTANCAA